MKGGVDSLAMFMNTESSVEVHQWCSKRPTLAASRYCNCATAQPDDEEGNPGACSLYTAKPEHVLPMGASTGNRLSMHSIIGNGTGNVKGWYDLWKEGKMSILPGVGRWDHGRSHFLVKDAAAKGVSVGLESVYKHGWLAQALFANNILYCAKGQEEGCVGQSATAYADAKFESIKQGAGDSEIAKTLSVVDGISLANAAAGPNAMEITDGSIDFKNFNHISGFASLSKVQSQGRYDYQNPFLAMEQMSGRVLSSSSEEDEMLQCPLRQLSEMTEEEAWAMAQKNLGLKELLSKEASVFSGVGVLQAKLTDYMEGVAKACPQAAGEGGGGGFPPISEWGTDDSGT